MNSPGPAALPEPDPGAPPAAGGSPAAEPVRGGHPGPELLALSGREQLRRQLAGRIPDPPLARLLGLRLIAAGDGTADFEMPLTGWLDGGSGRVGPGALVIPADGAMACAVMSQMPAGTPITTSELALRVLRAPRPEGRVIATGRVVAMASPLMLSEVTIHDGDGDLLAHGSSLLMTTASLRPRAAIGGTTYPEPSPPTPDPWQRPAPPPGSPVTPLARLLGLAEETAPHGEAVVTLPASPWFCAPPPARVQGGIISLLADAALAAAVGGELGPQTRYTPVELKVNLLRPLASDGRLACARARVVNQGRRVAVALAEVSDADGRAVAIASGSGLLGARS